MVFSSLTFLYYFLTIVLFLYFIVPPKYQNIILFISSLIFYLYGEGIFVLILIFSCIVNYVIALLMDKTKEKKKKKLLLILAMVIDFGMLFYFKYFNFFIENINAIFGVDFAFIDVLLPIGISFFTFQSSSYVIDVYKGEVKASKSFLNFATYLALFPQLVAGPIVRYQTIEEELKNKDISINNASKGITRFVIGLSKKVLLANVLGEFSAALMDLTTKSALSYILVSLSNTFQLYLDFSAYSDMAIGLGLIFGFKFLENFDYPLISKSITEFWRRWHISLSSWFRDYVYIPLGGNRKGLKRQIFNILVVWLLTGFWHGASYNFILWGLYFAVFLLIEKAFLLKYLEKSKILSHIYTIVIVVLGFVLFNEDTLPLVWSFYKGMIGIGLPIVNNETIFYLKNYLVVFILSILASFRVLKYLYLKVKNIKSLEKVMDVLEVIGLIILFIVCTSYIVNSSFNPFLYFRF